MKKRMIVALLVLGILRPDVLAAEANVAGQTVSMPSFQPQTVRSDFEFLYETLQEAHFDLYAHRPKSDYDAYYRSLRATICRPMDMTAVALLFQKFVAYGRIGHARVDAPTAAFVANLRSGGTFLPLFIRVDDDRVILTETADENGVLRAGSQIMAIDGEPIHQVLDRLAMYVSAERPYMAHAQMEESFPALLWFDRRSVEAVMVEALVANRPVTVSVSAITLEQRRELAARYPAPKPPVDFETREYKTLGDGLAYLRPGPFFNTEVAADGSAPSYQASAFREFIDDSFRKILASGATDLLIDLRNNPGGDNSFSDPMIAWFADRPFRFTSSFMLKASAATKAEYARQRAAGSPIDPDFREMMEAEERQPNGVRYRYELPMVKPRPEPRFHGRVWILINRHSYSNAASVAALVQDYKFGKVIGEETADVASNYASVQNFTLPETKIVVTYPKSHFLRPNGKDDGTGVIPDFQTGPSTIVYVDDPALKTAIDLVRYQSRQASNRVD